MIDAVRRAFTLLDRRDRGAWLGLVPLAVVAAVLEALGAAFVFLLVRTLADPQQTAWWPRIARWLPSTAEAPPVAAFSALIIAFYLARNLVLVAIEYAQERVIQRSASRLAVRLLARYLHAPYAFHFRRSSSSLIHAVRDAVDTIVEMVLASTVHIASELLVAAGLLVLLAAAAPAETLAVVAAVLVLIVAPLGVTRRLYARWGREERRAGERMIAQLQQSLDSVKQIAASGREDYFVGRYAVERSALERVKLRRTLATTTLRLGVETVFICAMLLAIAMLAAAGRSGADAVSVLGLFAYAGFRIVPSANRIIRHVNALRYGRAFVDAVVADWRGLRPEVDADAEVLPPFHRAIACEAVTFTYEGASAPALSGVTFTIGHGTSLGIVGATGAGKSTIVDLILGLLPPGEGRVLVDGRDVRTVRTAWLGQVGYVPQEAMLVDDTLRRNIAFGIEDRAIDDGRVMRAIAAAQLDPFLAALPDGLESRIGERGARLSGGERQRIAIARALYHEPAVLIFDEATSALDAPTERGIADAIVDMRGQRTVIVVAHRLATVRACDRIVVLERGRVVAEGRYDELLTASEVFRALAGSP